METISVQFDPVAGYLFALLVPVFFSVPVVLAAYWLLRKGFNYLLGVFHGR